MKVAAVQQKKAGGQDWINMSSATVAFFERGLVLSAPGKKELQVLLSPSSFVRCQQTQVSLVGGLVVDVGYEKQAPIVFSLQSTTDIQSFTKVVQDIVTHISTSLFVAPPQASAKAFPSLVRSDARSEESGARHGFGEPTCATYAVFRYSYCESDDEVAAELRMVWVQLHRRRGQMKVVDRRQQEHTLAADATKISCWASHDAQRLYSCHEYHLSSTEVSGNVVAVELKGAQGFPSSRYTLAFRSESEAAWFVQAMKATDRETQLPAVSAGIAAQLPARVAPNPVFTLKAARDNGMAGAGESKKGNYMMKESGDAIASEERRLLDEEAAEVKAKLRVRAPIPDGMACANSSSDSVIYNGDSSVIYHEEADSSVRYHK